MKRTGSTIGLYLPEILYAFILIMFVSAGAGPYSLDAAILRLGVQ